MYDGGQESDAEARIGMRRFLRDNGLSITMFGLFFVFVAAQSVVGLSDYNSTQREHGRPPVGYVQYLQSGDFVEAVFENWESEFLQMGSYVVLTAFLFQRVRPSPGTRRRRTRTPVTARTGLVPTYPGRSGEGVWRSRSTRTP